jgi:beta-phosphoglucomutase-like phosphatase (HAD superfamily)
MPDTPQKRLEEHVLQSIASASNPNERERRLALELLEARDALVRIQDLARDWPDNGTWMRCAARVRDIAQIATLPERCGPEASPRG